MHTGLRRSRCEMGAGEAPRGFAAVAAACRKMQILSPPHPARHKGAKPAHEGCALLGILRQVAEKIYGCQCSAAPGHRHGAVQGSWLNHFQLDSGTSPALARTASKSHL